MENPLRGIYLNNRYYPYSEGGFAETFKLRNSVRETQTSRTFGVAGGTFSTFNVSILLENETLIVHGSSQVGTTTWLGVSQLSDFKSYIGALGASMPITFVTPYGMTYSVVPVGDPAISMYQDTPRDEGVEFRIDLTLETA